MCGFTYYTKVRQGNIGIESHEFCPQIIHVSMTISVLTNVPHFNSVVILFLCLKMFKVGGLSQQKCSTNCGT